jgi:septum formation protein
VAPADIDETPYPGERAGALASRLAGAKASAVALEHPGRYILAADTVVAAGRRLLPKAETVEAAAGCLRRLSGRSHDVLTAVCVVAPDGRRCQRLTETRVTFKRLSDEDIADYLARGEWMGKAGGYAIQGHAGAFVTWISGSYTGIVGLPLHESLACLRGLGYLARPARGD